MINETPYYEAKASTEIRRYAVAPEWVEEEHARARAAKALQELKAHSSRSRD